METGTTEGQQWPELFRVLNRAKKKSQEIKKWAIVLVGMSRGGKSATYNWMVSPQSIIGKREGVNIYYVPRNSHEMNPQMAEIGHTFTSVTILPNVTTINENGKDVSFIDFGGFGQRRNPYQIMKVNYVLAAFLLKMSRVKFIIVVSFKAFTDISSDGFRDTISEFLNLFDFQMMEQSDKLELLNSVSMLITSAQEIDQEMILEQLQIVNKNLGQLYNKNKGYMEKYPECEQMLNNLIQSKRVGVFPLAKANKCPQPCNIIPFLNKNGWKYFELELKEVRKAITYPYANQFQALQQEEQKNLVDGIESRFYMFQRLNSIFSKCLSDMTNRLCEKELIFTQEFEIIEKDLIQVNFYDDLPKEFRDVNQKVVCDVLGRVEQLTKTFEINSKIVPYGYWMPQAKSSQRGPIQYYSFLKDMFLQQMDIFEILFAETYEKKVILKQIAFIGCKAFDEAVIFENLNRNVVYQSHEIGAFLKETIKGAISFGDTFMSSPETLKSSLVMQIHKNNFKNSQVSIDQCIQIINYVTSLESTLKQIDSIIIYSIAYKLHLLIAEKLLFSKEMGKSLQFLLNGLLYIIKHQICLRVLQSPQEKSIQGLLSCFKQYLERIICILLENNNKQSALKICDDLNQYSLRSWVFERIITKEAGSLEYLKRFADHCQKIGSSDEAIKYYRLYMQKTGCDCRHEIQKVTKDFEKSIYLKHKLEQEEKNVIFSSEKVLKVINQIQITLPNKKPLSSINIENEQMRYRARMKNLYLDQTLIKKLPKNPNNFQFVFHSLQRTELVKGKKINVLLSPGPKRGKSCLAVGSVRPLMVKQKDGLYCYDSLDDGNEINRINHGNNPTQYPNILAINEEEVVIDFVDVFYYEPDRRILALNIMETLLTNSHGFRFIFVIKQQEVIQTQCQEIVNFFKFLIRIFQIDNWQNPMLQQVGKCVYFAISFVKKIPEVKKKLKNLRENLNDREKIIENEKAYQLTQTEQVICYLLLKSTESKVFCFEYPKPDSDKKYEKIDLFRESQGPEQSKSKNWIYFHQTSKAANLSSTVVNSMLSTEIKKVVETICQKITLLQNIYNNVFQLIYVNFQGFKAGEEPQTLEAFQKMKKMFSVAEIEVIYSSQTLSKNEKVLKVIKELFEIKHYFINEQDELIYDDYERYFKRLIYFSELLFRNSRTLCCARDGEYKILESWHVLAYSILYEMQQYAEKLSNCNQEQLRRTINNIKDIECKWQSNIGSNLFNELSATFLTLPNFKDLLASVSLERREESLNWYKSIMKSLKNKKEAQIVQVFELVKMNIELAEAQIDLYMELNRTKDLIKSQIYLIYNYFQNISIEQEKLSVQEREQQITLIIQTIIQTLEKIALQAVNYKPDMALKIGNFLGNLEIKEKIYERLLESEKQANKKEDILIELIDLSIKLGRKATKVRELIRKLLSFLQRNDPRYEQLSTPAGVRQYRQKHLKREEVKQSLNVDNLIIFTNKIEGDLDL